MGQGKMGKDYLRKSKVGEGMDNSHMLENPACSLFVYCIIPYHLGEVNGLTE